MEKVSQATKVATGAMPTEEIGNFLISKMSDRELKKLDLNKINMEEISIYHLMRLQKVRRRMWAKNIIGAIAFIIGAPVMILAIIYNGPTDIWGPLLQENVNETTFFVIMLCTIVALPIFFFDEGTKKIEKALYNRLA